MEHGRLKQSASAVVLLHTPVMYFLVLKLAKLDLLCSGRAKQAQTNPPKK